MADLDKSLEDPEYVLWVQAGTCIGLAKKGLESFVTNQSGVLHQRIRYNVIKKFQQPSSISSMCPSISVVKKQNRWRMNCFPSCQDCQLYLDELDTLRVSGFKFEKGNWNNANIDIWPTSGWDMAKVFMNPGQDRNCQRAEDTDLSGILNVIAHCSVPNVAITNTQNIKKVRDSRNAVMHSSTFKVKPKEFQDFADAMVDLLEDQTRLSYDQDAKNAVVQIKEVKGSNFTITTDAEFRVLRDRALELQKENKVMQENVKYMQDQCDDLEGKDDEQSKTTLAQLVKDIDEREKNLKELRSTFSKLEHLASRKQDLKAKMEEHTIVTAAALHATNGMLANVKKSYRALTKQEQDFIDQAIEDCSSIEEKYDALQKRAIDLNTENENIKAENLALSTSNTENENTMKQMQQEIDEMKRTLQDCKNDLNSAGERADQLQEKLDTVNEEHGKLASENQKLQADICKLVDDKRSQDAAINELREKKETLEKYINDLKEKLDLSLKETERLSKIKQKLEVEVSKFQKLLEHSQEELKSIKREKANTEAVLKNKINELELLKAKLEKQLTKCQEEMTTIVGKNTDLNKRLKELNNLKLSLKQENEKMQSENDYLQRRMSQLGSQNQTLKGDVQRLTYLNSKFKKDIDGVSGLKKENDKLKMTDSTIYRIWCLSLILYISVFLTVCWYEVLPTIQ